MMYCVLKDAFSPLDLYFNLVEVDCCSKWFSATQVHSRTGFLYFACSNFRIGGVSILNETKNAPYLDYVAVNRTQLQIIIIMGLDSIQVDVGGGEPSVQSSNFTLLLHACEAT